VSGTCTLKRVTGAQNHGILILRPNDLQPDRQPAAREAIGNEIAGCPVALNGKVKGSQLKHSSNARSGFG